MPKVYDNYVGVAGDECGCCGGVCAQTTCVCGCQDGGGVLVKHDLFKVFGRQISWNACYTPGIATNVMAARPEFGCYEGCAEAIALKEGGSA